MLTAFVSNSSVRVELRSKSTVLSRAGVHALNLSGVRDLERLPVRSTSVRLDDDQRRLSAPVPPVRAVLIPSVQPTPRLERDVENMDPDAGLSSKVVCGALLSCAQSGYWPKVTGGQFAVVPSRAFDTGCKVAMLMSAHPRLGRRAPRAMAALGPHVHQLIFAFAGSSVTIPLHVVANRMQAQGKRFITARPGKGSVLSSRGGPDGGGGDGRPTTASGCAKRRVTRVHHRATDITMALKPFNWRAISDPKTQRVQVHEANAMLSSLNRAYSVLGPCLVPCYGVVYLEMQFCIVLQHARHGSLQDVMGVHGRVPEPALAGFLYQCLVGVQSYQRYWSSHACDCGMECTPNGGPASCVDKWILRPGRVLVDSDGGVLLSGFPCSVINDRKLDCRVDDAQFRKHWFYTVLDVASGRALGDGSFTHYTPVFALGAVAYQVRPVLAGCTVCVSLRLTVHRACTVAIAGCPWPGHPRRRPCGHHVADAERLRCPAATHHAVATAAGLCARVCHALQAQTAHSLPNAVLAPVCGPRHSLPRLRPCGGAILPPRCCVA